MADLKIEEVDKNMKGKAVKEGELVFYNPIENSSFAIKGFAFFDKEKKLFRIPEDSKGKVTDAVYWLASQPSGGQIRFSTNSKKIAVRVQNKDHYQMCHMTSTGQQGVDIYYKEQGKKNYVFYSCSMFGAPNDHYESVIFKADTNEERSFIINLPLYEGIKAIEIGLQEDATLSPTDDFKGKGKIVWYGTSVTQGGCASRPGMSYTNILSRKLNQEIINLGFSGSGLGEPVLAEIITTIDDVSMVVLDYEANGGGTGDLEKYMEQFIDILRNKWKTIPIVIITKTPFSVDAFNQSGMDKRKRLHDFQYNVVANRNEKGDPNIYFIDGYKLLGKTDIEECTVDGIHLTDLGFYRFANNIYPYLKKLLNK